MYDISAFLCYQSVFGLETTIGCFFIGDFFPDDNALYIQQEPFSKFIHRKRLVSSNTPLSLKRLFIVR